MAPHFESLRTRVDSPTRPASTAPRPRRSGARQPSRDTHGARVRDESSVPERRPPPLADHGLTLLIIFTSSALLVVALVVLAGAVDQMWILAPIMLVDFAVTAAVLVTVAKLLQDSSR